MNSHKTIRQVLLASIKGNTWRPLCLINWRKTAPLGLALQMWGRDFMFAVKDPMGKDECPDCGDPWSCRLSENVCGCKGRRCQGCYRRTENTCQGTDCESPSGTFEETTEWCTYGGRALCDNCEENCGMCPWCYNIERHKARTSNELRELALGLLSTQ